MGRTFGAADALQKILFDLVIAILRDDEPADEIDNKKRQESRDEADKNSRESNEC